MKLSKLSIVIISLTLLCATTLNFGGCTMQVKATDLMQGITANKVTPLENLADTSYLTDFSTRLFKASDVADDNVLVSPLSVLYAIAMTANGADGETLNQIEKVLGIPSEEMNLYLYSYLKNLPQGEKYKLTLANSVWFTDDERFTVNNSFLQTNADYYGADIYEAPFNKNTCKEINKWVNNKTDGMIPEILDNIPADALMYLVNALAFEAEWTKIYERQQVNDGNFTNSDGTISKAEFMYSTEVTYLQDENAQGFMKYYKDGKYAFVAMLPDEDLTVPEYVSSLDGEKINRILSSPSIETVYTSIPKFETECFLEMSDMLKELGMTDAFDMHSADFSKIGTSTAGNIYISRILHKTFISVGEKGTKAGAVTVVEAADGAAMESEKPKEVYLDRPFVYMIIDCENLVPLFMGTVLNM